MESLPLLVLHAMLKVSGTHLVGISGMCLLDDTVEYWEQRTLGVLLQTTKTRPRLFTMRHASHSFFTADRTLIAYVPRLGTLS